MNEHVCLIILQSSCDHTDCCVGRYRQCLPFKSENQLEWETVQYFMHTLSYFI
jgi:hypothetical protein